MKKEIFKGVGTAIVTPMKNGEIDYCAFENLLQRQIDANVYAVIVLGTTGEPCTINAVEREEIIKMAVEKCKGKTKVIVGCGANDTRKAIELYLQAEKLNSDGALIVTPYYNKCTQKGIVEHYKAISHSGSLPIIAYNVPSRTGVNILPETMLKLAEIDNVVGVKEASGNIVQILEYFRLVGSKVAIYSGEDSLNSVFMGLGGAGVISVASNVVPKLVKNVCDFADVGDMELANEIQLKILPFISSLFVEVNPIPVKYALHCLGLCENELRLPLTEISAKNELIVKEELYKLVGEFDDCL